LDLPWNAASSLLSSLLWILPGETGESSVSLAGNNDARHGRAPFTRCFRDRSEKRRGNGDRARGRWKERERDIGDTLWTCTRWVQINSLPLPTISNFKLEYPPILSRDF